MAGHQARFALALAVGPAVAVAVSVAKTASKSLKSEARVGLDRRRSRSAHSCSKALLRTTSASGKDVLGLHDGAERAVRGEVLELRLERGRVDLRIGHFRLDRCN